MAAMLVFTIVSKAQDGELLDRGYFGLNIGMSAPTSDFGSTDKTSKSAGFAKSGIYSSLQFCYQFGKKQRHGIILQYSGHDYDLNNSAYSDRLSNALGSNVVNFTNKGKYGISMFGIGHNIRWVLKEKHSIAFRYVISYSKFSTPGFEATFANGDKLTNSEGNGSSLAFSIGVHYKYNINNKWCFLANLDNTAQTFKYNTDATFTGTSNTTLDNTLSVSNYNISAGIGYLLLVK